MFDGIYQLLINFQKMMPITIHTCFIKSDNVNGLLSIMSPSIKSIVYPASMATNANQASSQTDPAGPNSHVIFLSASNYRKIISTHFCLVATRNGYMGIN